ncbi:hypothetical protein [Botrimarina sp.]|uniref:hypothetical protein n=1 Tax=Botrimarina sp. TaxID=2795802 RepID=UPI0032EE2AF8
MPPIATERCDVAFWDVSACHGPDLSRELTGRVTREGKSIATESGEWLGRRVVQARPRRVTAAAAPSFLSAVEALLAAHRFSRLVVVGPVAVAPGGHAIGEAVMAAEAAGAKLGGALGGLPPIPTAPFVGSRATGDQAASDWAVAACRGAESLAIEAVLVGVVVARDGAAPRSRPRTAAREAGRFFGSLLRGESPRLGGDEPRLSVRAAEAIVRSVAV